VGLKSLKSLNLTNGYPNNNKVKSKPLELRSRVKNYACIENILAGCAFCIIEPCTTAQKKNLLFSDIQLHSLQFLPVT
jgi:hypothetical protein